MDGPLVRLQDVEKCSWGVSVANGPIRFLQAGSARREGWRYPQEDVAYLYQ